MKEFFFYRTLSLRLLMRVGLLPLLLMTWAVGTAFALDGKAQDLLARKVTLRAKQLEIKRVLREIEQQADIQFVYSSRLIPSHQKITYEAAGQNLEKVLDDLLKPLRATYEVSGKTIILRKETVNSPNTGFISDPASAEAVADQAVSGKVTDEKGEGLPGVNVVIKGTSRGTTTDASGAYRIVVPDANTTLVFSYVGYASQELAVGGRSTLDLVLSVSDKSLDEVVVVGYGEQKKSNVTGSIVSVKASEIAKVQSPSFDNALQGKVPGVYVTTNGGQPGGGISVRIRGVGAINNSNPLYIVDGVQIGGGDSENSNPLATINTNDIESIDILKDAASTAIYGTRAANGVVLITTKRGSSGAPRLSWSSYYGLQNPTRKLPNPLNATQFGQNMNAAFVAAGQPAPYADPTTLGQGTNWIDEMMQTGQIQEHQFSIAGGGAKNKYFVSANYFNNDGMMIRTWFERMSVRVNTDNQISDKVKIGNSLSIARINRRDNGAGNRQFIGGVFTNIYQTLPTMSVYNDDGTFAGPTDSRFERPANPVFDQLRPKIDNEDYNLIGNLYAEYQPVKRLIFRTSFSGNVGSGSSYTFNRIWTAGLLNSAGLSSLNVGSSLGRTWIWENTLTYTHDFGKHNLNFLLGTTALDSKYRSANQNASYDTDAFQEIASQGAKSLNTNTNSGEESLASVFGRISYSYADRYLLTVNLRQDGSSKFGANKKYGIFPSISGGWRISEESFFPKNAVVSDLKIRAGWGQVGSDAIGNFMYLARVGSGFNYAFGNQTGQSSIGAALSDLGNPDIKWETVTEYNIGLESGLFNNRLNFSAEYFNRTRTDMLLTLTLPGVSGLQSTVRNVGSLTNKGMEFNLGYRSSAGELRYSLSGNLTTYDNKVVSLGGSRDIVGLTYPGSGAITIIREGQPLGVYYGLISDGLFQTPAEVAAANALDGNEATPYQAAGTAPGDFKYKDLNGDGKIDESDKTIIGNPTPSFTYGFGGEASYKKFDLSLQFFGVSGNDILNLNRTSLESSGRAWNKIETVTGAWSGPGTSNSIPRPILSDPNLNSRVASHLVENGSYLRLKNIQLGYTISGAGLKKLGVSSARVYLAVQNAFVLTRFSGVDPEVGLDDNNSARAGIYNDLYPQARTSSLGIRLDF
ncbi:TonB-linked SusC/RagA family outer membrane protein [Larkinella arboricola]|uniref:TonB-linked SusC/RagA family outer membrane protein n=1 Tax=Larkinella arboricola TaxID=643671 RepID=A0A327X582_LARAB|nr:TonB-dependent receptor [Larkinella arboricola]RAK00514.1 TonB-linked SusC/RagA family outer membrane protein [Larkinella arboricola]